jgi:hypothetical protein
VDQRFTAPPTGLGRLGTGITENYERNNPFSSGGAATVTTWALLIAPVPSAPAAPSGTAGQCPDVQVVFARGTDEPPGVGEEAQAFVDSLRTHAAGKSVGEYAVNYPASWDSPEVSTALTTPARTSSKSRPTVPLPRWCSAVIPKARP